MRKSVGVRVRASGILAMVVLARVRQKSTFVHRSIGRVLFCGRQSELERRSHTGYRGDATLLSYIRFARRARARLFRFMAPWPGRSEEPIVCCTLFFLLKLRFVRFENYAHTK